MRLLLPIAAVLGAGGAAALDPCLSYQRFYQGNAPSESAQISFRVHQGPTHSHLQKQFEALSRKMPPGSVEIADKEEIFVVNNAEDLKQARIEFPQAQFRELGKGRFEIVHRETVIRVLEVPEGNTALGAGFPRVFAKMKENGIPVIVQSFPNFFATGELSLGQVISARIFEPGSTGYMIVNANPFVRNTPTHWHESRHAEDLFVDSSAFFEDLGPMPPSLAKILEEHSDISELSRWQAFRVRRTESMIRAFMEARAHEAALGQFFTKAGFKEVVLSRAVLKDMASLLMQSMSGGMQNWKMFGNSIFIDPGNPGRWLLPVKGTVQLAGGFTASMVYILVVGGAVVSPLVAWEEWRRPKPTR